MRSEKRNRVIAILMAVFILIAVPAAYLRVLVSADQVGGRDFSRLLGLSGTFCDRDGEVIRDARTPTPDVLGNLIGFGGYVDNSLYAAYKDELVPRTFDLFTGIRSVKDKQGSSLQTTLLPLSSQQALANGFCAYNDDGSVKQSYNGAIFAYNYVTGEVYTALSLPSMAHFDVNAPAGAYFNKVLKGTYTPGSTMKIVAMLTALQQHGVDLDSYTYTCTGKQPLPNGSTVTCLYPHGANLTITDAIGKSCNCFITTLASTFDVDSACKTLADMGIYTEQYPAEAKTVDALRRSTSSTVFQDPDAFAHRWAFAGQGATAVSCIDMAMIAGAIAGGGQAAKPYLVQSIVDLDSGNFTYEAATLFETLFPQEVANQADTIWTNAFDRYYKLSCAAISYAKTGTVEHGDGTTSRSLLGVMKEYDTAFFIYVEGLRGGDNRCTYIAGILAEELTKLTKG